MTLPQEFQGYFVGVESISGIGVVFTPSPAVGWQPAGRVTIQRPAVPVPGAAGA